MIQPLRVNGLSKLEGPMIEQAFKDLAKKKEGYLKVTTVDCNSDDKELLEKFVYCQA